MTDTSESTPEAAERPVSRLVIEFPQGPGTAAMQIKLENVHPGQVYGAAWLIDSFAAQVRMGEIQQMQRPIEAAVPGDVQAVVQQIMGQRAGRPS